MTENLDKKEEQLQWVELYEYIKNDILFYDKNIKLPKNLILRLKGLRNGKFMANKNHKSLGDYTFKIILTTFKLNKYEIIQVLSHKEKFKDENHMINYLMAIIESKINDTYTRIKSVENSNQKCEEINININEEKAEYKNKTKEIKNSKLKSLLKV